MASVTVDILARVVGYELSIKALLAALAKVDPGSDIGKSITKAMELALGLVKVLSKNMFPKASSDSLIDAIIEKTNRAGEAILHVAALLQNVLVSDLNLGAFGGDIETFKNLIASLQTELDSKLSAGIVKAVGESELLKNVFQELGTDLSKATGATLLEDLSKGALKAADNVTDLEKKLEKAQTSINNYLSIDNALKSSKLGTLEGRTALDDELKTITVNYDAVIELLRATMVSGFNKLKTDTKLDTDGLLKAFFSDLTPENVLSHILNLFNTLSSQGVFGENEKRKFYEAIFGGNNEYNTNNVSLLTKSIGLDKAREQYKALLQEFYQKIVNDIDGKDLAQIGRLIKKDQLEKAVSETTKALDSAYNKVFNSIKLNQERLNSALSDKDNIVLLLNTARLTQDTFSSAELSLRQEIEAVRLENKNLENLITLLRELLNQKLSSEVGNIRNAGTNENHNIGQGLRESLEISEAYKNQLAQVAAKEQALGKLLGVVQRWFSIYAAIRMVRQAIDSVISTVKELDATITEIAIVTSMDLSELWDLMPKYTQLARDYAASIGGVYQVSQLYYQQGLQTADVMALTELTLKMARISGLDYAQATDYMTNAIRSFKMEMTDALQVVDVYSAIAASSATSVTELASAMSKTASSAQAVGSSFENTTAMMAVMIEATRESAENIGSAMKSIISRYGEMTSDPSKLMDSEGEEMSLNRVDKALLTVGISIHNAAGEFRNFDEVIMELAEKWDTIDTNTLRYIATIMAGNRQQSRFLALVSSYDRLKELSAEAADSEDASQLLFLKTLDSVAAKQQLILTNILSLYTSSGIEDFYKTVLDLGIKITKTFDELGSGNGLVAVIGKIGGIFGSLATLVTNVFKAIKTNYSMISSEITAQAKLAAAEKVYEEVKAHADLKLIWNAEANDYITASDKEVAAAKENALAKVQAEREAVELQKTLRKELAYQNRWQTRGMAATAIGLGASTIAATMDTSTQRVGKGVLTGIGGIASGIGTSMMLWLTSPIVATIMGLVSVLPSILEAFNILNVSISEKISQMQEDLTSKSDEKIKSKDTFKTLESYKLKWDELNISQYESNEKREEFLLLNNDIAASYPELISRMDEEGNYIVNMAEGYKLLAEAKREAYRDDLVKAAALEVSNYEDSDYLLKLIYNTAPLENLKSGLFNLDLDSYEGLLDINYSQEDFANEVQQIFSTRGVTNANMRTAERLFGGEKKDLSILSSTLTDEDTYLTKESENILSQLYLAFIELIKSGVDQVTAETNIISSGEFDSKYNELIKNFDTEFYTQLLKYLNLSNFSDTLSDNKMSTYMTEYIDILSSSVEDMGIESSKIQKRYMKERLLEAWKNSDDKKIFDAETDIELRKKIIEDFFDKHGNAWYYATFTNLEDVISTLTKELNEFYENLGKYTLEEIEKMFPDDATMASIFHKDYDDIISNYTEWYNKSNVLFDTITDFSLSFGSDYLSLILGSYLKIINSASSNTIKNERLKALDDIYNSINQTTSLAPELKNMVLEKVISSDLFSLTGISDLIETLDTIKGIDFNTEGADIKDSILKFKDFITINLNTEINSILESYSEGLQSLSDSLNKVSKGMNLKEAVKAADELGLTLADFNLSGNKFYIKDLTKLKDHYIKIDTELRADIQKLIDLQKELYQNLETGYMIGSTDSFDFEKYKNLSQEEQELYYQVYLELIEEITHGSIKNFEEFNEAYSSLQLDPEIISGLNKALLENAKKHLKLFNLNSLLLDKTIDDFSTIEKIIDDEYATLLEESGIDASTLKNNIKAYLESNSDKSFSQYVAETLSEELANIYEASEEAVNYLLASTAIFQGNLDSLLDLVFGKEGAEGAIKVDREAIKNLIAIGETDNLPEELQKYSTLIQDTFKSVRETTVNALISAIGDGSTLIKVTDLNKGILKLFQDKQWIEGDIKTGEYVTIAAKNLLDNVQIFELLIVASFNTNADRIKALTEFHNNLYKNSSIGSFDKILTTENFAYEDLLNYLVNTKNVDLTLHVADIPAYMKAMGLAFNSVGEVIVTNYTAWILDLEWTASMLNNNSNASQEEKNAIQAKLDNAKHAQEQAIASGFDGILKDYSNISVESVEALANALGVSYEYILSYLTSNGNGTYLLDTSKLPALLSELNGKVSQATIDSIEKSISSIGDAYLSNIKNATSYTTKGASSLADVEAFRLSYADIVGSTLDESAFLYDTLTQSFILDPTAMHKYIDKLKELLIKMGYTEEFVNAYITDLTDKAILAGIELDSFLNADTSKARNDEAKKLILLIRGLSNYKDLFNTDTLAARFSQGGWSEAIAELYDQLIIETLESGGQNAIALLKQIKPDASSEELEAVYNNLINKLRQAQEDLSKSVGETISGTAVTIAEAAGFGLTKLNDGTAVINSIGDMVIAHNLLYLAMEEKNASIADKNTEYANILTALDLKNIDTLETLQDAYGMSYQAFADLMTQYGQDMKTVLEDALHYGEITSDGFGNLRIEDFKLFAEGMGWDLNSPEIKEAYNNWVEARAEWQNKPAEIVQNAADLLKNLSEAKTGESVNISYLLDVLNLSDEAFNRLFEKYNVTITNGLLLLEAGVDIPGLITDIANQAAKAGLLLPELLAELADAVEDMLSLITSLITGGIKGSLSNVDALKLTSWAKEKGIEKLNFTRTADGLRLATDSARELYSVINLIDGILGLIVFDALKESLIEVNDEFKTVLNSTAHIAELERKITGAQMVKAGVTNKGGHKGLVALFDEMNGNVDLYNRNRIERPDIGEDVYSTIETATLDSRNFETDIPFVMNITPIPPDALTFKDMLSDAELDEYVQSLLDLNPITGEALLELDKVENGGKGLIINLRTEEAITDEIVENESDRAQILHEVAAVYEDIKAGEEFDSTKIDQYREELNLAKQINAERSTTEDDSFKFMENDIPSGLNNPLNYWKNWAKAFDAMKEAGSKTGAAKNTMAYEDFYNIVSEMGRLADITGEAVVLGEHTLNNSLAAADLITLAAGVLKNVDGELVIDLSGINIDFTSGLDDLGKQVDTLVDAFADSQIAMLDSLIALLEVIVAMENLQDVDADADMTIDLDEIFEFKVKGDPTSEITGFTEEFDKWRQSLLDLLAEYNDDGTKNEKFNKDLSEAIGKIKIDGINLKDMIEWDTSDWNKQSLEIRLTYSDILSVLFKSSLSDNYDEHEVADSILQVLKESGLNRDISIDVGDYTVTMTGGLVKIIDWTTDNAKNAVARYIEENQGATEETAHNEITKYVEAYNNGEALAPEQLEYVLEVYKHITIKDEKTTVTWGNDEFDADSGEGKAAIAAWRAKDAGVDIGKDWDPENAVANSKGYYNFEYKITADETVNVKSNGTDILFFDDNGNPLPSLEKMFKANYEKWASENLIKDEKGNYITNNDTGDLTYEAWKYARYNIRVLTLTAITDKDGKKYDPINDPSTRQAVKDIRDKISSSSSLEGLADVNAEGNIEVPLENGLVLTLSGEGIVLEDGSIDLAALIAEISKTLGLDTALQETISSAIKDALSGITEQLNSLDPGKLSEVGSALAEIAASLADIANKDIEKLIEQIKELQSAAENQDTEIDIPENKKDRVIANAENIDGSEVEGALTGIIHGAAETVANDGTFKEEARKTGESGGLTLVDNFGKELSNMAEQVMPLLAIAAASLGTKTAIMGEAGKQLGKAGVQGIKEGMTGNVLTISSAINAIASSIKTSLIPVLTQVKNLSKLEFNFDLGPDTENTAEVVATILETLGGITELRTQTIRIQAPGVDGVKNKLEALLSVLDAIAEKASIMINAEVGTASETPEEPPKEDTTTIKYEQEGEKPEPPESTVVDYIINIILNGEITHIFDEMADYIIDIILNGSIPSLHDLHATYTIDYVIRGGAAGAITGLKGIMGGLGNGGATGNFGLAKAKGTKTLMGELGPELVVSNGRYFVAGQNGAEMVNLDDDAIVFNHLQTELLLKNGMSKGRGRAVTNERNAVAFATGNVEGPAMASASAALNALKQLRAMWESLKSASISDLAGAGGNGGGGGGSGDNAKIADPSIWVDTVERWYNLMLKIAKLEKEITHEEKLRSKLSSDWTANGNHYYASQKRSLEALRDLIDAQEQLNLSREAYYDQRVEALQNLPFGKLIEFDNEGQMRFKEGAMDWLTNLVGFDQNGKANYTDEEKYNILMAAGYGDYMKYDSSGGEIKMDDDNDGEVTDDERQSFYGEATLAFWDKINDYKDATQSLWDSIKEGEDSILQLQADLNELLEEIRENQMAVEDAVLDAIEDMRQREIDALLDERDKLEESTLKYIDGLSDALDREKEMYLNLEDESSLNQLKRRLAILQRSGGSAEDIANLRSEIDSSERERYFNLQQLQIDAILRASDLEIERMDSLIELMTEALDYLKEYGLLWGNVYEVMDGTAQQITSFITNGNSEFWASSELATLKVINEQLFAAEQWTSYRNDLIAAKAGIDANTSGINDNGATAKDIRDNVALMVTMNRRQLADTDYTIFDEAMKAEFGEDYDPNSAYKQLFYDDYMGHGDVTRATATARAKYAADKKAAEDAAAAALAAAEAAAAEETYGGEPEEDKGCPDCAVNCGGACYNACENGCSRVCKGSSHKNDPEIGNCNGNCQGTAKGHTGTNTMAGNAYTRKPAGKAAGGYVNHGIYELGERGTETVLTASQTRVLRENILSNRPNSLISLLKSYNEGYDGINNSVSGVTPVEDNSTIIEKVELNMEVKQIANDYDARRAGEQALNEMMRIARKTGAANSIRR